MKKCRLGYLEQKGVSGSTKTVWDEVSAGMDRLQLATQTLEEAEKRVENGDCSEEALLALDEANAEFDRAGGFVADQRVTTILQGLGFAPTDHDRRCSEFSGGWQMRIALARLLLSDPDLMLLDEPTNHLDKAARNWLANYLASYVGTLVIVSHDTALLDRAANSIAEVRNGKIELYKSRTHQQWLVEREERVKLAQTQYEANQREIERLQAYVDRFGAKTMGASLAQSKLKEIAKLTENGPQAPILHDGPSAYLKLATPPRAAKVLLQLQNVKLGWGRAADVIVGAGGDEGEPLKPIIQDCNIVIERGMRIAVRGPNGAGKSTLLSALSGKLAPVSGKRVEGDGLALGTFTQDLAQDLDQKERAVDVVTSTVRAYDPTISDEQARGALGALGLVKEKALRVVGELSGGEKARVALASFVLIPHNVLLLDEPSNHLDVSTIEVLTRALRDFAGAVLVVSHDRQLLEALEPTHVITVKDGRAEMEERGLSDRDWSE
jgi:ATPase subunit of ABC transporter with duplicated ATPase domains